MSSCSVQLRKAESVSSHCEASHHEKQFFGYENMSSFFLNLQTHKLTHSMAKEAGEHCLSACTVIQKDQCRGGVMCFCSLKISNQANHREARCRLCHNQVLLALADTICAGVTRSHSKQHHPAKVTITRAGEKPRRHPKSQGGLLASV